MSAVSRVRLSEREEESLSCYLRACDAALSFLQELDKVNVHVGYACMSVYFCTIYVLNVPMASNQMHPRISLYLPNLPSHTLALRGRILPKRLETGKQDTQNMQETGKETQ